MAEFHCFPSFAQTQLIQQIFIVPGTVPCAREQNYYASLPGAVYNLGLGSRGAVKYKQIQNDIYDMGALPEKYHEHL